MDKVASDELYNRYFFIDKDEKVIFNGEKMIIQLPAYFVDSGVVKITQTTVQTLGIFEGLIFDDPDEDDITKFNHKFTYKLPCNIVMMPSHIEDVKRPVEDVENDTLVIEKSIDLVFLKGDTFMLNRNIVQELEVSDQFIDILLKAHMPQTIKYAELPIIWQQCALMNGSGDLESSFNMLALIVMNLTRDPKDLTVMFRKVYKEYYAKGIFNGKMVNYEHIPKYTSGFTALTSWDPKYGVTVSMEKTKAEGKKDIFSPVEESIK